LRVLADPMAVAERSVGDEDIAQPLPACADVHDATVHECALRVHRLEQQPFAQPSVRGRPVTDPRLHAFGIEPVSEIAELQLQADRLYVDLLSSAAGDLLNGLRRVRRVLGGGDDRQRGRALIFEDVRELDRGAAAWRSSISARRVQP
jgi:hypothetical protein